MRFLFVSLMLIIPLYVGAASETPPIPALAAEAQAQAPAALARFQAEYDEIAAILVALEQAAQSTGSGAAVTEGDSGAIPIAIAPFSVLGVEPSLVDVAGILASNLTRSGQFQVVPRAQYPAVPEDPGAVLVESWSALGVEYLVTGRLHAEGESVVIEFHLFDVLTNQRLRAFRMPVPQSLLRRGAHRVSDMIYEEITGEKAALLARLAAEREHAEREENERRAREAAERQRQEEETARREAQARELEQQRLQERLAEARERWARQREREAAERQARQEALRDAYVVEVQAAVQRLWQQPVGSRITDVAIAAVTINPDTGRVLRYDIERCTGTVFCESVRQTMDRLQNLPRPPEADAVRGGIRIRFAPQ
jgi:TolB-like protein